MRTVYKVTVEASVYDDEGNFVRSDALLELGSPRPEALLRTAPVEVEDALRDLLPDEDEDDAPEPAAAPVVGDLITLATSAAPKTRRRRTKAEIAADKAREEAAKALPAVPAPVPAAPEVPATEPGPVAEAQPAAPVAVPEPVPAESAPATTPPAAAAPPAAPWNPFEQR